MTDRETAKVLADSVRSTTIPREGSFQTCPTCGAEYADPLLALSIEWGGDVPPDYIRNRCWTPSGGGHRSVPEAVPAPELNETAPTTSVQQQADGLTLITEADLPPGRYERLKPILHGLIAEAIAAHTVNSRGEPLTDAGNDRLNKLKKAIGAAEAWLNEPEPLAVCVWCADIGPITEEALAAHIKRCEYNPTARLIAALDRLVVDSFCDIDPVPCGECALCDAKALLEEVRATTPPARERARFTWNVDEKTGYHWLLFGPFQVGRVVRAHERWLAEFQGWWIQVQPGDPPTTGVEWDRLFHGTNEEARTAVETRAHALLGSQADVPEEQPVRPQVMDSAVLVALDVGFNICAENIRKAPHPITGSLDFRDALHQLDQARGMLERALSADVIAANNQQKRRLRCVACIVDQHDACSEPMGCECECHDKPKAT